MTTLTAENLAKAGRVAKKLRGGLQREITRREATVLDRTEDSDGNPISYALDIPGEGGLHTGIPAGLINVGRYQKVVVEREGGPGIGRWRLSGIGSWYGAESPSVMGGGVLSFGTVRFPSGIGFWVGGAGSDEGAWLIGGDLDDEEGVKTPVGTRVEIRKSGIQGYANNGQNLAFMLLTEDWDYSEGGRDYFFRAGDHMFGLLQRGHLQLESEEGRLSWRVGDQVLWESWLVGNDPFTQMRGLLRLGDYFVGEGMEFGKMPGTDAYVFQLLNKFGLPLVVMRAGFPEDPYRAWFLLGPPDPFPNIVASVDSNGDPYIRIHGGAVSSDTIPDSALVESYLLASGTRPLTGNWAIGGYNLSGMGEFQQVDTGWQFRVTTPTASHPIDIFAGDSTASRHATYVPTLRLWGLGSDPTDNLSMYHTGTDGVIGTGAGNIRFNPASGAIDADDNALHDVVEFVRADSTFLFSITGPSQQRAMHVYTGNSTASRDSSYNAVIRAWAKGTDASDWIQMEHNDTLGLLQSGAGNLKLTGATGIVETGGRLVLGTDQSVGMFELYETGSSGDSLAIGAYLEPRFEPTAGAINRTAVLLDMWIQNSSQNLGAVKGLEINPDLAGTYTGTVTNAYAWMVQPFTVGGGAITNNYGIYVFEPIGGSSLNYPIYVVGGETYLGGNARVAGGSLFVGVNDSTEGLIEAYGGNTGTNQGGKLRLYLSDANDASINYYVIDAWQDDFRFYDSNSLLRMIFYGAGNQLIGESDTIFNRVSAITGAMSNVLQVRHNTSGTPGTNFGAAVAFQLDTTTTESQQAGRLAFRWTTATYASRAAHGFLSANDSTGEITAIQWGTDGSGSPTFSVLGATRAAQQTGGAATAGATYGSTEQTMLQKVYDMARTFGFLS